MTKTYLTRFIPKRLTRYGNNDLCPLDGDVPVLQFINTLQNRGTAQRKDHLKTYDNFITWCYETGLVDQDEYNILEQECYCYIDEAAGIVNQMMVTREMLYEIICCLMLDVPIHPITMSDFNAINDEANRHLSFAMTAYGFQEVWVGINEEMAYPLWQLMVYARRFLASGDIKSTKKCCCGNLFLDKTKNQIRQYCNPLTCGSARRSKRYYQLKNSVLKERL